ncbi:hypothetical protein BCR41DRAFT_362211 [Lobosporangium transversale]|uniref:Uncharacterized protein n=1 Tax=Lobosporangium transversale TaxID=64571 RepID=A0A1Y2GB81_9FUNG|nr:hypothetical protein BCR41DRAFT_362211 [Lobosporangium transversale]ORZ05011.1 hypothetical protein BCR41DRAFT_362211 [Lobosporangium transversale]|eukprot:XP_021876875.1 hypothetical protein BCR41DRAFT_362211 [Lobosporangium transversale]
MPYSPGTICCVRVTITICFIVSLVGISLGTSFYANPSLMALSIVSAVSILMAGFWYETQFSSNTSLQTTSGEPVVVIPISELSRLQNQAALQSERQRREAEIIANVQKDVEDLERLGRT